MRTLALNPFPEAPINFLEKKNKGRDVQGENILGLLVRPGFMLLVTGRSKWRVGAVAFARE